VNREQFQREIDYGTAMILIREMLESGLISKEEYSKLEKIYARRYRPIFGSAKPPKTLAHG
jgi:uncharacterized protein YqgQ